MPDNKFHQDKERNITLLEAKQRIIDLMENGQNLPEVEWDAEPVRYFKLNEEWCERVFGWLAWLEEVAGWRDAEDYLYPGIQGVIKFEEGIKEIVLMSPEELTAAICEAIECSAVKISKRIVSGITSGFEVDEDGNVVVGGADGASDVPDDPETSNDEALEARNGEAIALAYGYAGIIEKMLELYGPDAGENMPVADAQFIMKSIYDSDDALMDAAVAHYWTYRAGLFVPFTVLDKNFLAEEFYCSDLSKSVVLEYVFRLPEPFEELKIISELWGAIEPAQEDIWIREGQQVPSTAYIAYQCTPIATEEFTLNMATAEAPQYTTTGIWKAGHRMRVECEGTFTDPDNPLLLGDCMYTVDTSTGVKTWSPTNFNFAGMVAPTQAQVPYRSDHKYNFTVQRTALSDNAGIISRSNAPANLPGTTGILSYRITDLGQYA